MARRRYVHRLSGPLLDRIDLQVQVQPVTRAAMDPDAVAESSAAVAGRVLIARAVQRERWAGTPWRVNSQVPGADLRRGRFRLSPVATKVLDRGVERGTLSVRGYDRILRCAWTLADLGGLPAPGSDEVARAYWLRDQSAVAA